VAGSIVTYLRRYAFAATLALYADEDDDGNGAGVQERGGFEPGGRFEDLPADRPKTSAPQQPATGQKPTAGPAAGPTTPVKTEHVMVAELRKRLGPNEAEFVRCLQTRAADKEGRVILPDGLGLDHIADAWAKYFLSDWDNQIAKVDLWCQQNPIETKPIEVPRDANIDCHSPDAPWRVFPMPWGEKKGTPLAKLEKKYLFGLWANVTVETTYKGQPKKPETIAADTKFREMLDEAGKHYEFHLK